MTFVVYLNISEGWFDLFVEICLSTLLILDIFPTFVMKDELGGTVNGSSGYCADL